MGGWVFKQFRPSGFFIPTPCHQVVSQEHQGLPEQAASKLALKKLTEEVLRAFPTGSKVSILPKPTDDAARGSDYPKPRDHGFRHL